MNATYEYHSLVWAERNRAFHDWLNEHFANWEIIDIRATPASSSELVVTARRVIEGPDSADPPIPSGVSAMRAQADEVTFEASYGGPIGEEISDILTGGDADADQ